MMSHKPMVGAWSQLPCRGHPAGWGHRSGKVREMLELPGAGFPGGHRNFLWLQTPPSC